MHIKLDHINLTVNSFDETCRWYKEVFGFELVENGITAERKLWGILAKDDSMVCISENPKKRRADEGGEANFHRIYHFGIRVSDESQWEKTVEDHQLKLYFGGVNEYSSSRSWYIKDPSGHTIEVSYSGGEPLTFPA